VRDLETSRMGAPYIYDISRLRVNNLYVLCRSEERHLFMLKIWITVFWNALSLPDSKWSRFLLYAGNCQSNYMMSLPVKAIIWIITAIRHYPMLCLDWFGKNTENPQDSLSLNFEFQTWIQAGCWLATNTGDVVCVQKLHNPFCVEFFLI